MDVFWTCDWQACSTEKCRHQPRNAVDQVMLDLSLHPNQLWPPILDHLPPLDWRPDWAVDQDHWTTPPSLQQLRATQLGRTPSQGRIHLEQVSGCFDWNDTVLGHLPSEPLAAVQTTKFITSKIRDPSGSSNRGLRRVPLDSQWELTGLAAVADEVRRGKRDYVWHWTQCMALDQVYRDN